jgi:hypothetical protein
MATAKTRTITRYRAAPRRRSYSRSRSGGMKVPLAAIVGLLPAVQFASEPAFDTSVRLNRILASFVGYSPSEHKWTTYYLPRGLYPFLAGLLIHGIADRFGVNRAISRWNLPVEI